MVPVAGWLQPPDRRDALELDADVEPVLGDLDDAELPALLEQADVGVGRRRGDAGTEPAQLRKSCS